MKRSLALLTLFVALLLCACDTLPQPTVTTAEPTVGTTVDMLLDMKFQDTIKALNTFQKTGGLINDAGVNEAEGYTASEIYTIFYNQLLEEAEHPEAEKYLNRFYFVPDVAVSVEYVALIAGEEINRMTSSFAYENGGRLIAEPVLRPDGNFVMRQYGYNHTRLSSVWEFDCFSNGESYISGHTTYNYDYTGNLLMTEYLPSGGGTAVRSYYENGLLVREEKRGKQSSEDLTYTYEDGRLVRIEGTEGSLMEYFYNDAGQCISRVENGAVWELSYDNDGNLVLESYTDTNDASLLQGKQISYTYENGRLTKRTQTDTYAHGTDTWTEQIILTYIYGDYCIYHEQ